MHDFWPEGRRYATQENQHFLSSRAGLEAAWRQQIILEGLALRCDPTHALTVQLGDPVGVIPREECALGIREGSTRDIAILTCVGKAVSFVVTGFANGVPQLSRRLAQERALAQLLQCQLGDILPATVTHLEPYGAFVDIGVHHDGLVHISKISERYLKHPSEVLSVGDVMQVAVIDVDVAKKRISLSMKKEDFAE